MFDAPFKGADGVETVVASVEGAAMQGVLAVTPLVCGDESSMTRWTRKKGLIDPLHQHDDHESIAILISGKLRMPRGFLQNPAPFLQAYWQPPAWGWVDPVKEILRMTSWRIR